MFEFKNQIRELSFDEIESISGGAECRILVCGVKATTWAQFAGGGSCEYETQNPCQ